MVKSETLIADSLAWLSYFTLCRALAMGKPDKNWHSYGKEWNSYCTFSYLTQLFHSGFCSPYSIAVLRLASSICPFFPGHICDFWSSVISSLYFHKPFPPLYPFTSVCSVWRSSLALNKHQFSIERIDITILYLHHFHCAISQFTEPIPTPYWSSNGTSQVDTYVFSQKTSYEL